MPQLRVLDSTKIFLSLRTTQAGLRRLLALDTLAAFRGLYPAAEESRPRRHAVDCLGSQSREKVGQRHEVVHIYATVCIDAEMFVQTHSKRYCRCRPHAARVVVCRFALPSQVFADG